VNAWIGDRVDAVIFDNDGTLVDSEPITLNLLATMAVEAGAEVYPEDAHQFTGGDIKEVFAAIEDRAGVAIDHEAFFEEFRARQGEQIRKGLPEIDGASRLLDELAARQVPFVVASNAPRAKMELCLQKTRLDRFFSAEAMLSAYELGVWKPDPAIFLAAADRMDTPIERCAVIEDSRPGIAAAVASGGHAIALDPLGTLPPTGATHVRSLTEAARLLFGKSYG